MKFIGHVIRHDDGKFYVGRHNGTRGSGEPMYNRTPLVFCEEFVASKEADWLKLNGVAIQLYPVYIDE